MGRRPSAPAEKRHTPAFTAQSASRRFRARRRLDRLRLDGCYAQAWQGLRALSSTLASSRHEVSDLGGPLLGRARKAPVDGHARHQLVVEEAVVLLLGIPYGRAYGRASAGRRRAALSCASTSTAADRSPRGPERGGGARPPSTGSGVPRARGGSSTRTASRTRPLSPLEQRAFWTSRARGALSLSRREGVSSSFALARAARLISPRDPRRDVFDAAGIRG